MQSVEDVGNVPVTQARTETRLNDIATLKLGTMPGLIERFNGQHIVSLTANIHDITLGEAAPKLNRALAAAGAPPRGVSIKMRGEIPALEQTLSGLRTGLLLFRSGDPSAADGELPIAAAGAGDCVDDTGGAGGSVADAADHRDDAERAVVHGRDYGDWNRGGEFDSAGDFRGEGEA